MLSAVKRYSIDHNNGLENFKIGLGSEINKCINVVKGKYRFATMGGAVGSYSLIDDDGVVVKLPLGAIVTKTYIKIVQAFVSTGNSGTIALTLQSAGDVLAAVDADTLSGVAAGIQDGAAANMLSLTAERTLTLAVATAAMTAGQADVFVEYVLSE